LIKMKPAASATKEKGGAPRPSRQPGVNLS
jgi:hypothetical protein